MRYLTWVGAGLASFLANAWGRPAGRPPAGRPTSGHVIPFIFTQKSKSDLGWNFLSVIETGRFQDYLSQNDPLQVEFNRQLEHCQMEILPGPGQLMRWGVPDGTRDTTTGSPSEAGALVHDDLVISAALCTLLDDQTWGLALSEIIPSADPLSGFNKTF